MSDQNVITDYRAYFAALGPGTSFTPEQLEAMRDKAPVMILIMDTNPGSLMDRRVLTEESCFEEALELWTSAGKPAAWLMHGNSSAPMYIASSSVPTRKKVRSQT